MLIYKQWNTSYGSEMHRELSAAEKTVFITFRVPPTAFFQKHYYGYNE